MSIPNLLSLLRLVLVPVFAVVFFQPAPDAHRWAVLIYLTAFLTDVADGWIARHFNQITKLGRILDPLADKLMTFTVTGWARPPPASFSWSAPRWCSSLPSHAPGPLD